MTKMSVCLCVCHAPTQYQNNASYDHEIFTVSSVKTLMSGLLRVLQKFKRDHHEHFFLRNSVVVLF